MKHTATEAEKKAVLDAVFTPLRSSERVLPASKNLKCLLKQMTKHRDAIAKERDALRKLQSEIEDLLEPTNRGVEALDDAIQSISEQA